MRNLVSRGIFLANRVFYRFVNLFSRANLKPAIERAVKAIDDSRDAKRVLNIGAGGKLGEYVKRLRSAELVELDNDPARQPDIVADICAMPEIPDDSFDAIFVLEVLEHVPNPQAATAEIFRILKPGGFVLASTPFVFEIHEAPHDYFRYTRYGLAHLFSDFDQVSIEPRNGYVFATLVPAMRLIMSPRMMDMFIGWIACALVFTFFPLLWVVNSIVKSEAVTSGYIVRAQKPSAAALN